MQDKNKNKLLDSLRASGYWAGPPHKLGNSGRAHPKKKQKNSTLDCRSELQSRVDSSRTDETINLVEIVA